MILQPLVVTIAQTRELTSLGRNSIYKLINEGRLRTVKTGRRTLVDTASIRELLGLPASS
ncbi:helix-turn-helix domain-containing protein [Sphingobium phenoxybenzoativorans]|uniref:helix-turn-helix domain-containing protein n=1 Tax=Sphingobium phenoxybenzoativorans TaxID=1592790 RepID=UPI001112E6A3